MNPKLATIVTGANRGIGRAIALRMAKETAVVACARTAESTSAIMQEIEAAGGIALGIVGDVARPETVACGDTYVTQHGLVPRNLILNAGIGKSALPHEYETSMFQEIMDVNVMGAFHFIKEFVPRMIENGGGTIVLMSSVSGLVGSKMNVPYTASKHALIGMAKSMAKDYGADGIVTVALCPGYVETEMTERSIQKRMDLQGLSREASLDKIKKINPQHRLIPPEEIAEMVAFVCSGKVPSLSGSAIVLSGGV